MDNPSRLPSHFDSYGLLPTPKDPLRENGGLELGILIQTISITNTYRDAILGPANNLTICNGLVKTALL